MGLVRQGPVQRQSKAIVGPVCYGPVRLCDSWNNSWDRCDSRDKWTDVWKSDHNGNRWIHGWNEHYHDDNWTDAWRECDPGYEQQHDEDNSTDAWNKCKSDDEWRASHWETSSWSSSHWETSGWNDAVCDDRKGQQWSSHSFFETMNMDQLINSFCRSDSAATFSGIEVDPGESLADTAAQSGVIDVRPFRKAEEALFHKFGLKPRVIPGDNQAVDIGGRAKVLGKVEMPSGMGGVSGTVKCTVVDSPSAQTSRCRDRFEQQHDGSHFENLAERTCGSPAN